MRMNKCSRRAFGLDLWHVASDALTSFGIPLVMRVLFECGGAGSIGRKRTVAVQAECVDWFDKLRVIIGSVHIVTTEAGDPAPIHDALHEIIALHPVLVRSAIREVVEVRGSKRALFQPPVILESPPHLVANRPVVVFAFHGHCEWPSLRVTLDAGVAGINVIGVRGIEDVGS